MSNWRLVNSSGGQVVKRSSSEQVLSSVPDRVIPITLEVVLDVYLLSLFSLQKGKLFLHEHFFQGISRRIPSPARRRRHPDALLFVP